MDQARSDGDLGTVLGVFAHPDDEAYLAGGLMATAVDAGRRVVCITATRGELGFPDDDPRSIEANHEAFANHGTVVAADAVERDLPVPTAQHAPETARV